MAAIAAAMPNGGTLTVAVGASSNPVADGSAYPIESGATAAYGNLHVYRANVNRVDFRFDASGPAGNRYVGFFNSGNGDWMGWVRQATIALPTWYNLAPASGYTVGTALFKYCKDGGGTVHLTGAVQKGSVPASSETIAILPEGFRPGNYISFVVAQLSGATGAVWNTVCCVEPSGIVRFFAGTLPPNFSTAKDLVINVSFPAAS